MFIQKISPVSNIKFKNNLSKNDKATPSEPKNIEDAYVKLLLELYGLKTKASADIAISQEEENKTTDNENIEETPDNFS